ncbi:hypothetical protein FRB99_000922, partial [Tulasnella sp. 403]
SQSTDADRSSPSQSAVMPAERYLSQGSDAGCPGKIHHHHAVHRDRGSSKAPLYQLPPETLHHILGIVLQLEDSETPNKKAQMRPAVYYRELYDLRLVCKRWNDVLVSFPKYWSLVDLSRGERTVRMVLDRAGAVGALLAVCWEATGALDKVVELMLQQMHRIHSLQMTLTDAQFQSFSPLLRCQAPFLHHAGLSCITNNAVRDALFAGHAPCLQSLFLSGVVADWNTQAFPRLASLNLSFATVSVETLSAFLIACPRLVNVYLDSITFTHQKSDVEEPIFLPDLQSFTIRSLHLPQVARLLSRLRVPCCKTLCIHEVTVESYPPAVVFGPFMKQVSAGAEGRDPLTPVELELGPDRIVCKFGGMCYRLGMILPPNCPFWEEILTKLVAVWGDGQERRVTVASYGVLASVFSPTLDLPAGWKVLS